MVIPDTVIPDTIIPDTVISDMVIPDTVIPDTDSFLIISKQNFAYTLQADFFLKKRSCSYSPNIIFQTAIFKNV